MRRIGIYPILEPYQAQPEQRSFTQQGAAGGQEQGATGTPAGQTNTQTPDRNPPEQQRQERGSGDDRQPNTPDERTFSQSQLNAVVADRIAAERTRWAAEQETARQESELSELERERSQRQRAEASRQTAEAERDENALIVSLIGRVSDPEAAVRLATAQYRENGQITLEPLLERYPMLRLPEAGDADPRQQETNRQQPQRREPPADVPRPPVNTTGRVNTGETAPRTSVFDALASAHDPNHRDTTRR